jgi:hypothetical protein
MTNFSESHHDYDHMIHVPVVRFIFIHPINAIATKVESLFPDKRKVLDTA